MAASLLIPDRPWLFLPRLAELIGTLEAIIIQQLFWIMNDLEVEKIEMGADDWSRIYFFIRPRTLRRRIESLMDQGVLVREKRQGLPSLFHIDHQALANLANQSGQSGQGRSGQSGQPDLLIRYILKKMIYPLDGSDESEVLETLKRQAPHQLFVTWWNAIAKDAGLVICTDTFRNRSPEVQRVCDEGILEHLATLEKALASNPWYSGANDQGWVADLDWFLKDGKWQQVAKIGEGHTAKPMSYKQALNEYTKLKGTSAGFPGDLFEHIGNKKWRKTSGVNAQAESQPKTT